MGGITLGLGLSVVFDELYWWINVSDAARDPVETKEQPGLLISSGPYF